MTAPACHFVTEIESPDSGKKVCAGTADMLACQLCPNSPTYWRRTAPPGTAKSEEAR